jgi:hypothetical protein
MDLVPAAHAFTATDAGVFQFSATLKTAGTKSITAADALFGASVTGIAVSPAGAASFTVAGFASPTSADATNSFLVTAKDPFGNVATGYLGTVTFATTNGTATLPPNYTFTALDAGVHSFSAQLSHASSIGTFNLTATDTVTASIMGSQLGIQVNPGAPTTITVAGFPNPIVAGVQGFFLVTVKDAFSNTVTGYRGTVHFSTTNTGATVPPNYTFLAGDAGSQTFAATLTTASSNGSPTFSISVNDTTTVSIAGSQSGLVVKPAAVASFSVVVSPTTVTAGVALNSVTVTAKDSLNNTATGYTGTVHFTSTDTQATSGSGLPADSTLTNGAGSFSATLKTAGNQTIKATDTVTASIFGVSNSVTVNPAAAANFLVVVATGTVTAGATADSFTVTARDAFNNIATGYRGTANFTSSDGQATFANVSHTFTVGDAGVFSTDTVTFKTVGSQTVTATDSVSASTFGVSNSVTVNPAAAANFLVVVATGTVTAGATADSFTVAARDAFNNIATGYRGTANFTSSDGQATFANTSHTFTVGDAGVFSADTVTFKTVGAQTVTTTDSLTASIFGVSNSVTVNPAAAANFLVVVATTTVNAGATADSFTVTARDPFNNTATGYRGTANFTASDGQATFANVSHTFTAGNAGVFSTDTVTFKTVGSQTVTATDSVTASIFGVSNSVTVNPGATTKLVVMGTSSTVAFPTSVVSGIANTVTVIAEDVGGNTTPAYTGTIHFASNDLSVLAGSGLPADYTFTGSGIGGDGGIHTFTGGVALVTTTSAASITVSDAANSISPPPQLSGITVVGAPLFFGSTATLIVGGSRAGQIFITGGNTLVTGGGTAQSRTYLYNPADSTMLPGPTLNTPRYFHTATATSGGQVVIAGGSFASNSDFEFELCPTDGALPATCTNVSSGLKNSNRCNGAAALVTSSPSFRVIIAGGDNCSNTTALQSAEVWDSSSPTTTTTLNSLGHQLTAGRRLFTATPLGGSLVLFAGGASTATADIFTNNSTIGSSGVAATTGGMSIIRSGHTATLLKSGVTTACPTTGATCVLIAGGITTGTTKTWEIYDSSSNAFGGASAGHELVVPGRNLHAAAVFNNARVLLAGGNDGTTPVKSTESFDPTAVTLGFTTGATMTLTRNRAAGAYATQDLLIVVGGNTGTPAVEQNTSP